MFSQSCLESTKAASSRFKPSQNCAEGPAAPLPTGSGEVRMVARAFRELRGEPPTGPQAEWVE
eukprot:9304923-Alexandrium_andersonii.AAC.1